MKARSLQDRMLAALMPAMHGPTMHGDPAPPEKWQQRKSALMRERLVSAAIDCLVAGGYPGLTTAAVANACSVSRGAMHHHFPTRLELVSAVVDHVVYHRMRTFLADYFAAAGQPGAPTIELAVEAHWRSVQTRDYAAWVELAVAARTDGELAAIFEPAARRYDAVWTSEMTEAFPQWGEGRGGERLDGEDLGSEDWENLKLAHDFTSAIHMGMLLHAPVFGTGDRLERLRRFAACTMQRLSEER